MHRLELTALRRAARVLAACCDLPTLARVVDSLLCCDAEPQLSDAEVSTGEALFDELVTLRPDAVEAAVEGASPQGQPARTEQEHFAAGIEAIIAREIGAVPPCDPPPVQPDAVASAEEEPAP